MAADFNADETVDGGDLDKWKSGFGTTTAAAPYQGDSDGDMDVDGFDFLEWQRMLGPDRTQLVAFRPQGVYEPIATPTPAPIYDPIPRTAVREADETSNTLGPGIRINNDDDDLSGIADRFENGNPIVRENDLVEVRVDRLIGTGDLVLVADARLSLFYDHDKDSPVPLNGGGTATEPLPFSGNVATVFVEWSANTHGFANLSLVDPATSTTIDTVRFHSFRSMIVVFGGNSQNPRDTDGDGSIGDFVEDGPPGNREGIFDMAQELYETGWDVYAFDEEEVDDPPDVPFTEIVNGHENRFLDAHMIMGYSQGGGATHDLIERLYADEDLLTRMGVYIDAVDHDGAFPENDWPDVAFYLLNFYQEFEGFMGGPIDTNEPLPGTFMDQINVTDTLPTIGHTEIDQLQSIFDIIVDQLDAFVINR